MNVSGEFGADGPVHEVFGLRVRFGFPLDELPPPRVRSHPDLLVNIGPAQDVRRRFSGPSTTRVPIDFPQGDGQVARLTSGVRGDRMIEYGDVVVMHLSADRSMLLCAPRDVDEPTWRRFLLDTGLGVASLAHGFEALHSGSVLGSTGVIAITAGQGGGKSTLTLELVRRGHALFCDDVLALRRAPAGEVLGYPGPALANVASNMSEHGSPPSAGRILAELGDEYWTAVERPEVHPAPVAVIAVLDRDARHRRVTTRHEASPFRPLLKHALRTGSAPDRRRSRFELFADLASCARVLRLSVPDALPVTDTADELLSYLATHDGF